MQFIGHEEGRIRFKFENSSFHYDYMLKDHLGNVRMMLTEEVRQDIYPAATLENVTYNGGTAVSVEDDYYTVNAANVVNQSTATSIPVYQNNNGILNNNPYSNTTANSARLYRLNATTNTVPNKTGLGIALKVMAGDVISIFGKSYHKKPTAGYSGATNPLTVANIIGNMITAPVVATKGVTAGQITGGINFPATMTGLIGNQPAQNTSLPKAAINWIILDEQFKYLSGGFDMVGTAVNTNGTLKSHTLTGITMPRNGYIYIWCSNESRFSVFFDNVQVVHDRSALIEETHYYPFGLTMAGISSKALSFGDPENKRKFNKGSELQNKEFSDGSGLEWYATQFRSLDPQLGRWWQIDPKPDYAQSLYSSMNNNPISFNDPLGDTVRIKYGGFLGIGRKTAVYEDGKLYNKDGKTAHTGKVKGFLAKTTAALDKIRTGGAAGKELVGTLQKSTENFNIVRGSNGFDEQKGKLTNVISWSPGNNSGGPDANGNTKRPSFIGLAHELGHGYDKADDGKINRSYWLTVGTGDEAIGRVMSEVIASHWENMVRAEHGINLRAFYGIDNSSGTRQFVGPLLVPGTTMSMRFYNSSTIDIDGITHDLDIPFDYSKKDGRFGYLR